MEAPRLLRGEGRFVDDVRLPGMLHGTFVRSIHAHARLVGIEIAAAQALPDVVAVYTAADLGALAAPLPILYEQPGFEMRTHLALAGDRVRYAGEPIAFVVAASRYVAEDAAALVDVDYDPLPAVASLEMALAEGAPLVHPEIGTNVCGEAVLRAGEDVDTALATATHLLRLRLRVDRGAAIPLEGRGVVARWEDGTGLTVWASTQRPVKLRAALASLLGLDSAQVRVVAGDIGGGFGPKGMFTYPEEVVVPWAALRLGRPVKWIEDRLEHMVATTHSREQSHDVTVGVDRDGRIVALRDSFASDGGAYVPYGLSVPGYTAVTLPGPYKVPAYEAVWRAVYSNRTPTSPYRGSGGPYAVFVMERILDRIATTLGLDRAEVRRRNLITPGDMPYQPLAFADAQPFVHDAGDYPAMLDQALAAIDSGGFPKRQGVASALGRRIGLGVACYIEGTGLRSFEGARVSVDPSGRVTIRTGVSSQGQGHETTIVQIVADVLGVAMEDVRWLAGDTDAFGWGRGTYGSKVAVVVGNAAYRAASAVRERAVAAAGELLGAPPEALELSGGEVRLRHRPNLSIGLGALAARLIAAPGGAAVPGTAPGLDVTMFYAPERAAVAMGVHATEVEVTPTGAVRILRYIAVSDSGRAINPAIVDGQIRGGIAQGIGGALLERLAYDDSGALLNGNLVDYVVPRAGDVPRIELHHADTASVTNELGLKGAGEAGIFAVGAVLASAIEDALGLAGSEPIDHMPLLLQDVADLLSRAKIPMELRTGPREGSLPPVELTPAR